MDTSARPVHIQDDLSIQRLGYRYVEPTYP
jgi:hypothetical protein